MTKPSRLLVSDIDGTLLEDGEETPGLRTLRMLLADQRDEVGLVYATGRSYASTRELVSSGVLPPPDAVASFVGTEVWIGPWSAPAEEYRQRITEGWQMERVLEVARSFPEIDLQPDAFQTAIKVSYYLREPAVLPMIERRLQEAGAGSRLVFSSGDLLDVIPARAGKRNAVDFVRESWGLDRCFVLACGDSGNDADMLREPRFCGVAVGNAEQSLRPLARSGALHQSSLPFAAGVLEGAEVFGFWPRSRSGGLT